MAKATPAKKPLTVKQAQAIFDKALMRIQECESELACSEEDYYAERVLELTKGIAQTQKDLTTLTKSLETTLAEQKREANIVTKAKADRVKAYGTIASVIGILSK